MGAGLGVLSLFKGIRGTRFVRNNTVD